MDPESAYIPREQLPITLFDGVVLAVRAADGHIYLVLRDLCTTLELISSSQLRAIRADQRLHLVPFRRFLATFGEMTQELYTGLYRSRTRGGQPWIYCPISYP